MQFPDGHVEEYAANALVENIYSQVDAEGLRHLLLDEIINHHKDENAIHMEDKWIQGHANRSCRPTTKGWQLQVRWKNGTTSWEPLHNLKSANLIELAEYAIRNQLDAEPAFAWWVPHTIKRHNSILGALKSATYTKKAQKFGLEIPRHRPATKASSTHYYEYIFVYADDILVISEHLEQTMKTLATFYRLKDNSVAKPSVYLGVQIKEHRLPDNPSQVMWSMSAEKYLKEALRNLDTILVREKKRLPTKVVTPLPHNYRPELDISPLLDPPHHTLYMQLVGILCWAVELGRIDIHFKCGIDGTIFGSTSIRSFGPNSSYLCLYQSTSSLPYHSRCYITSH